jgi:hypothetical protein
MSLLEAAVREVIEVRPAAIASADQDPEIALIGTEHRPGSGKGGSRPVPVRRVDVFGELLKGDDLPPRHAPKLETALIHREPIVVHVPRPQGDSGGFNRKPEMIGLPGVRRGVLALVCH